MQKQAPSLARILVMVLFALSCFGILLYLWLVFGGSTPLKPQGYRFSVNFPEATQLAQEADVRISGVPVGKVKTKELDDDDDSTSVEIELDEQYAPIPADTRAILRQKTLLGETYVELTPGTGGGRAVPDGGRLDPGQVSPTVELDEIFRAFDAKTREAFRVWMDQQGRAVANRGQDLNDALGNLAPFAEDTSDVLEILDRHERATQQLVRDTGVVFAALTERQGQLRQLIVNSNRVFDATAARDAELAATFRIFPTFLSEARITTDRLTQFANDTDPLVTQLRPAARELSPTLISLAGLAPDLKALFRDLDPLITVSRKGLPALEDFLNETTPLLAQIDPFLQQLNPILDYLGHYKHEITAFFANDVASTQATSRPLGGDAPVHYLRTTNPVNPENLAAWPYRLATNRSNPYIEPEGYRKLKSGLEVLDDYYCTNNAVAPLSPLASPLLPEELRGEIQDFIYGGLYGGNVAPQCKEQKPLGPRLTNTPGVYPHVEAAPGR
jgi:phospholipid/cholesterol/gamma-HCH transport system substrate-binding protein